MKQTLVIFAVLFLGVWGGSRLDYLDLVVVVDDSSRLREFHRDRDRMLYKSVDALMFRVRYEVHATRLGLVTYNDKPMLHWYQSSRLTSNYCARLVHPLRANYSDFQKQFEAIEFRGQANDFLPETDAYAGIMRALDPRMKWREWTVEKPVTKVIVLLAGAEPCRASNGGIYNHNTLVLTAPNNGNFNYNCFIEDYYSSWVVAEALKSQNVLLYVFTWPQYYKPYQDLVAELGRGGVYPLTYNFDLVADQLLYEDGKQPSIYASRRDLPDDAEEDAADVDPNFPEKLPKVPEAVLRATYVYDEAVKPLYDDI